MRSSESFQIHSAACTPPEVRRRFRYGYAPGVFLGLALSLLLPVARPAPAISSEEFLVTRSETGRDGGRIVVTERAEPKTLNPVTALDLVSENVIRLMNADLIHINCQTQQTEPALAKAWRVSPDGRHYTLQLRRGMQFSDGHGLSAEDVMFSFRVYLDEKIHAPQRDLLTVGGKPIRVEMVDAYTVRFDLAQPDAAAQRLFDSVAILPKHLLEKAYQEGKLSAAWSLQTSPGQVAGLGPFRLKKYVPGQRLVLERNPYYWKVDRKGNRLPYLDEIDFVFVENQDAQAMRFEAGESDVISGLSAENFAALEEQQQARGYRLYDLGPGLEYDFLFFNLNGPRSEIPPAIVSRQQWFRKLQFRQAVSAAIDRASVVRLVYEGRATPLWSFVTPGNKLWLDSSIPRPAHSLARARNLLHGAGFQWDGRGFLRDPHGRAVEFSIITSAGNATRTQIATLIQNDLARLGMNVHVLPLESRSLLDRIFHTHDYDACLLGLVSGDVDPNPEMNVWLSSGSMHIWDLGEHQPEPAWQTEIDRLMREQSTALSYPERKRLYDRVQLLVEENLPIIFIVSPDVLVGARSELGNFHPAILGDPTLWNADQLFLRDQ